MHDDLLGKWKDLRIEARKRASDPQFQQIPNLTMEEHRVRVLKQLKALTADGAPLRAFPKDLGGAEDAGGNIAGFEEIFLADPSLQIKSGVQFGLFGAAVLHLGTKTHHDRFLPGIMSMDVPGAFAMTETGHGSDVSSVATTATYDEATGAFDLHTPFRGAWKDYLGNAAVDGKAAVVFAQLISKGVNHGVHAFYVPIRDENGEHYVGIGSEDDGFKGGLNGIDNGRLHFTHVQVPRENLLNRYGNVDEDGTYTSSIESPGRRFFTMLGTLVQGRVSLDGASVLASKAALSIAIRYGAERRQFTATDEHEEEVILDYRRHQRRLFVPLAETFAMSYVHERLLEDFDSVFSGTGDTPEAREDLETLAAGLKALSTWNSLDTLQVAREACGGAGFLAENRITLMRHDLDVYATFEGDNTVLLQLVGKRLLSDYAARFKGASQRSLVQYAAGQVADRAISNIGIRSFAQDASDLGRPAAASVALRRTETQRDLLVDRVEQMVAEVAGELRRTKGKSRATGAATFNDNQHALIEAARAWVELQQWEAFTAALDRMPAQTRGVMVHVRDLFGLSLLEKHAAWYLSNGLMSGARAKVVTSTIERLLVKIRPHALDLVATFGLDDPLLRAKIATGAEAARQSEAIAYHEELRSSGRAPIDEKKLKERKSVKPGK
ncbi:acyl-CoA dehydrogenase [Humidisolicoccus flavus]|uniref:acyl-CoA dehydrogenase family protein n=1 Tax=Humidisolicoccus flavus TaxID=3111414 RepID=UPI003249B08B